jgi:thioredoxin 1
MLEVNEGSFATQVLQSALPVMVEFGAAWCAPCKRLEPELEKLAAEWVGKITLAHVNIDQNPKLTGQLGIMGVPTVILFVGGKEMQRFTGLTSRDKIIQKFSPYLTGK